MARVRLTIEYDGSGYAGSQFQPGEATVQGAIEAVLERIAPGCGRVEMAGRTDAGVHALAQVVAFDHPDALSTDRLAGGLNALLPADIAVLDARACDADFDPRRNASARTYEYRVLNRTARPGLARGRVLHVARRLDIEAMNAAAQQLVGIHDFANFVIETDGPVTRRLTDCVCWRQGDLVHIRVSANAFAKRMVRRIAGALVQVGLGRWSVKDFQAIVDRAGESPVAPSAPAAGLFLTEIEYGDRYDPFQSTGQPDRAFEEIDVN